MTMRIQLNVSFYHAELLVGDNIIHLLTILEPPNYFNVKFIIKEVLLNRLWPLVVLTR